MNNNMKGKADTSANVKASVKSAAQWQLMKRLQEVGLTIDDLVIYLDTHVYDTFAIERYNMAVAEYNQLLASYEQQYGPLTKLQPDNDEANWLWGLQDFPWDYEI